MLSLALVYVLTSYFSNSDAVFVVALFKYVSISAFASSPYRPRFLFFPSGLHSYLSTYNQISRSHHYEKSKTTSHYRSEKPGGVVVADAGVKSQRCADKHAGTESHRPPVADELEGAIMRGIEVGGPGNALSPSLQGYLF